MNATLANTQLSIQQRAELLAESDPRLRRVLDLSEETGWPKQVFDVHQRAASELASYPVGRVALILREDGCRAFVLCCHYTCWQAIRGIRWDAGDHQLNTYESWRPVARFFLIEQDGSYIELSSESMLLVPELRPDTL